jgi:predicted PurR-regulated permease PerM
VWVFLTILDVPFALLLAFWAGLASLVPLVGATVGGIPYIAVAFFQGWPIGVAAIVFLIVYQQIENNVFQPVIHRYTVQLNPLWVILAVLVGGTLLGILGALLAIPIAGIVQVLVQEWWAARRGVTPPPAPGAQLTGPRAEPPPASEAT